MMMRLRNAVVGEGREEMVRGSGAGCGAAADETPIGAADDAAGLQRRQFLSQFRQFFRQRRASAPGFIRFSARGVWKSFFV